MYRTIIVFFSIAIFSNFKSPDWGFFGHRIINRFAVFTLPQEMLGFYKKHIEYLTQHAVDPDKRRYALKTEATRHYIDIDVWDSLPFEKIPRDFEKAVFEYGQFVQIDHELDTMDLSVQSQRISTLPEIRRFIMEDRYANEINLPVHLRRLTGLQKDSLSRIVFINRLAQNGVLPYFLEEFYKRLVYSFKSGNVKAILKVSADIGHYIGDAHVPLHTTINYNGELTDQIGIHAFWESRLPELYADIEYDFLVGKAEYISDIRTFVWNTIIESHGCLEEVLLNERKLREEFPSDLQMCYDIRNEITTFTQCQEFSKAYHESLDGMVEERMRQSIYAIGSIWFSAWIDAGQPVLDSLNYKPIEENIMNKKSEAYNDIHHQ